MSYTYYANRLRQGLELSQPSGSWPLSYAYDEANRLKTIGSGAGNFVYDYLSGSGNSATNSISVSLGTGVSCQYDNNGSMLSDGKRIFTYDDEDQLIGVIVTNGVNNSTQTGFVYDGLKRRRIRTEASWQGGAWATNQVVRYVYNGNLVIQERDGSNEPLVTYSHGLDLAGGLETAGGIGGLLCRTHPGSHQFFYHSDAGGNIMAAVNESQILVAQYQYDPYGNLLSMRGALAETNLYRFSSKDFHPASGLYYYGLRFYEPSLQRWLNRDPKGEDGDINLHRFCGGDPINAIDSWGMFSLSGCEHWQIGINKWYGCKEDGWQWLARYELNRMGLPTMSWLAGIKGRRYRPTIGIARWGWKPWRKRVRRQAGGFMPI